MVQQGRRHLLGQSQIYNGFIVFSVACIVYSILQSYHINKSVTVTETKLVSNHPLPATKTLTKKTRPTRKNVLPPALEAVTYHDKCHFLKENDTDKCRATCFTERAFYDSFWPYASAEDFRIYQRYEPQKEEIKTMRLMCRGANAKKVPPTKWCQNLILSETQQNTNHDDLFQKVIPTSCGLFSSGGGGGAYQNLMLFPSVKLAFCGIPKVGITGWRQFQRFAVLGAKDYQSLPHYKLDIHKYSFTYLDPILQKEILVGSSWTKAVFFRDPAERLLSAYLDKVQRRPWRMIKGWKEDTPMNFEQFITVLETPLSEINCTVPFIRNTDDNKQAWGLTWCTDPHWMPQAWSCGISELFPHFHFVGHFDDMAAQTKLLLQEVDLWESHGKHYRIDKSTKGQICNKHPPGPLRPGEVAAGFQQRQVVPEEKRKKRYRDTTKAIHHHLDTHGHAKGTKDKMEEYYTPELLQRVRKLYWMDYSIWDYLQDRRNNVKWEKDVGGHIGYATGLEIAQNLSSHCRQT